MPEEFRTGLDAYFNRAIDYERKGDLGRAIADYDKVLALNPESADAYANRGLGYEHLDQLALEHLYGVR